jgi:hypothetical protein
MNDEERQRTMDFILKQQAQFAVGMQKLEEGMERLEQADVRASLRLDRLERTVVLIARQFRRERKDLRERIAALADAQIRTEEAVRALASATERNGNDIAALKAAGKKGEGESGNEDIPS